MEHDDPAKKIIDFEELRRKKKTSPRKRALLLIITAAVLALVLAGSIIFFQAQEVLRDKSFWNNFDSAFSTSAAQPASSEA